MKKGNIKAVVFLMLGAVVFTELLTSNIPFARMIDPGMLFFLLAVGYGVPVLLIRELFVRYNMGAISLFLLGLAYGIWNEGILAKTMLLNTGVPISYFDGYAGALGINFPWAVQIMIWHALFAVLFPIIITHFFFKAQSTVSWLSTRGALFVVTPLLLFGAFMFFFAVPENGAVGTAPSFAVFVAVMGALYFTAHKLKARVPICSGSSVSFFRPLVLGVLFPALLFIVIGAILAGLHAPVLAFCVGFLLLIYMGYALLKKDGALSDTSLTLLGLGAYIGQATFTVIFMPLPHVLITNVLLLIILLVGVRQVWVRNR